MALTVYDFPTSGNARKVRLLLAELGLEFEHVPVPRARPRPDWYLELNPFGGVPTIRDGELVLAESQAILRYLATRERAATTFTRQTPPPEPAWTGRSTHGRRTFSRESSRSTAPWSPKRATRRARPTPNGRTRKRWSESSPAPEKGSTSSNASSQTTAPSSATNSRSPIAPRAGTAISLRLAPRPRRRLPQGCTCPRRGRSPSQRLSTHVGEAGEPRARPSPRPTSPPALHPRWTPARCEQGRPRPQDGTPASVGSHRSCGDLLLCRLARDEACVGDVPEELPGIGPTTSFVLERVGRLNRYPTTGEQGIGPAVDECEHIAV